MELALQFYARMDSFHRKNYNAKQREEANEQNHYVVAILKRTVGCMRIKVVGKHMHKVMITQVIQGCNLKLVNNRHHKSL